MSISIWNWDFLHGWESITMLSLPVLLSCVCVLVVTLYLQYRWRHRRVLEAASKLPCPPTLPLLGNAHLLIGDLTKTMKLLSKWALQYNGLYCIWIGPSPTFIIGNTSDAKVVLKSNSKNEKGDHYRHLRRYIQDGIITSTNDVWKIYRPPINALVRQSNLEQLTTLFNHCGESINQGLDQNSKNGPINFVDILFDGVLNSSLGLVFGVSSTWVADIKSDIKNLIQWVSIEHSIRQMNPLYYLDCIFYICYWHKLKQVSRWQSAIYSKIDEIVCEYKRSQGVNKSKHWTSLLDVWNEVSSGTFEDRHWINEITSMVAASLDTTTSSLSFVLMSLATNQEVQDKVYSEVKEVMGSRNRDLSMSDLNSLTYLGHAITETLRLHCIIPFIPRLSTKEIKLRDFTIPAGCEMVILLHSMGMNPDIFPEPYTFNPDRFKSGCSQEESLLLNEFLPFSWGPRICIGKTYAILIMKTIVAHIISKFRLVTDSKLEDIEYNLTMVNHAKNPLPIEFIPR